MGGRRLAAARGLDCDKASKWREELKLCLAERYSAGMIVPANPSVGRPWALHLRCRSTMQERTATMPSLYRPTIVTYLLPDGKHRTPEGNRVTKQTPGAVRKKSKSPIWWGQYRDAHRRLTRLALCKNKEASRQMLAKLETDARKAETGLVSHFEPHHKRPLAEHLDDFERALTANGASSAHVAQTVARAKKIIRGCEFVFINDLSASRVQTYLAELQADDAALPMLPLDSPAFTTREIASMLGAKLSTVRAILKRYSLSNQGEGMGKKRRYPRAVAETVRERLPRGCGTQTAAHYLGAIKQFVRWLVRDRRTPESPLCHLSIANAQSDLRRDRRPLSETDLRALIEAARTSTRDFRGLTGIDRAMLYVMACATGFRKGELAYLTPEAFALDSDPPCVLLGASQTKNKKAVQQPLPEGVVDILAQYLAAKPIGLPVWPGTWHERAAAMLRMDLEVSGIPYAVEGPDGQQFADFHALRHSFVALLDKAGVTLKQAMQLARHTDPKLTMKRYGRAQLHDLAGAVGALPTIFSSTDQTPGMDLAATGTFGHEPPTIGIPDQISPPRLARALHLSLPFDDKTCSQVTEASVTSKEPSEKTLTAEMTRHATECGQVATDEKVLPPVGFEPTALGLGNRCSIP
jgi:integrase